MKLLHTAAVLALIASPALAQNTVNPQTQNSGAGVPGLAGSKSGPATRPHGRQQERASSDGAVTRGTQPVGWHRAGRCRASAHAGGAAWSPLSSRVATLILGSVARKPKRSWGASTSLTYPSSRRPWGGLGRQGRRVVATA